MSDHRFITVETIAKLNTGHGDKFKKKTSGYPYIFCYEMEFNTWVVSGCEKLFRLHFS